MFTLLKNYINNFTRVIVKSARTKKFDGEIDLTFKNGGLESSIIYINHSAKFRRVSSNPGDLFYLTNNDNLLGMDSVFGLVVKQ